LVDKIKLKGYILCENNVVFSYITISIDYSNV